MDEGVDLRSGCEGAGAGAGADGEGEGELVGDGEAVVEHERECEDGREGVQRADERVPWKWGSGVWRVDDAGRD